MNALTKVENTALSTMSEQELITVLQSSLYPGAKLESIKMVLGYCTAAKLDPMKKPVHIVPMKVSTGRKDEKGWDIKETRDVIMPGVGMYRTEASRTGQYAGVSEPEFGPMQDLVYTVDVWSEGENGRRQKRSENKTLRYPEWCRVTVERIVDGSPRQFTAKEFWLENYATRGSDGAPNEMWSKRPMGQLSKCAEAQALRKAFPDTTGSAPTAEEMEGKSLDGQPAERHMGTVDVVIKKEDPQPWPADTFAQRLPEWRKAIELKKATADAICAKARTKHPLTEEQEAQIRAPFTPATNADADGVIVMTYAQVAERLNKAGDLDKLAEAGSVISTVADEQQRKELSALYDRRADELNNKE